MSTETVRQEITSIDESGFEPAIIRFADERSTVQPRAPEVLGPKKYGCV